MVAVAEGKFSRVTNIIQAYLQVPEIQQQVHHGRLPHHKRGDGSQDGGPSDFLDQQPDHVRSPDCYGSAVATDGVCANVTLWL